MSRRTYSRNAFEATITGGMTAGATTVTLSSTTGLTAPGYLVIDPDVPAKREWIKFTTINASALEGITRNLAGSVGDVTHSSDAVVRAVFTHQMLDDLFLDIVQNDDDIVAHLADNSDPHSAAGYLQIGDINGLFLQLTGGTLTGDLTLDGAPTNALHAATKAYVDGLLTSATPTGVISAYGAASPPGGYLLCNGDAVDRTTYATLFATIGVTYGVGNGTTTFNVPDLRGRFPLGKTGSGTGVTLGGTGGELDPEVNLAHTHSVGTHAHDIGHGHSDTIDYASGGSHSHTGPSHAHTGPSHTHTQGNSTASATTSTGSEGTPAPYPFEYTIKQHTHAQATTNASGTGLTGAAGTGNTGNSGGHSHTKSGSVTNFSGSSGGADGTTGPTLSSSFALPNAPFQTVNYIIKT